MRSPLLVLAISICTQCLLLHTALAAASRSPGEVIPALVEIETGGNVNVTCHMNLQIFSGSNSSSLYFEKDYGIPVPRTDIAILNETSIVYMLRNATAQSHDYVCKSGGKGIAVARISVGTAPLNISDFKCITYDYMYMVCNFTIPRNTLLTQYKLGFRAATPYRHVEKLNGTRVYRTIYSQNYYYKCKLEIQPTHGMTNLTRENDLYRPNYKFYNFTLRATNAVGENVQNFWINHYESVVPSKPHIHFRSLTTNSVALMWHMPMYSYYNKGLQYEIRLQPANFGWFDHSDYESIQDKDNFTLVLYNLPYAFYWYTVSVRVKTKLSRNDGTMWSEPFVGQFRTKACRPDAPPVTDVGSFYIDPTETDIRLYWHQLPVYRQNGPNFTYVVREVHHNGKIRNHVPLVIERPPATFGWDKHRHYEFEIRSRNAVGESLESSRIVVPAMRPAHANYSPKFIRNTYHEPNHTYHLSWSPPTHKHELLDYTVFWCQSKTATPNECKNTVRFQHVPRDTLTFITEPEDNNLNLAVSANYLNYNTGMHWKTCTADVTSDLLKMEPEITEVTASTLKVQWSTDRMCTSVLEGYNLTYCRVANQPRVPHEAAACIGESHTITVANIEKKYTLSNLSPYSTYKVVMCMFSKLKVGRMSEPLLNRTHEAAPSPPRGLRYRNRTSNSVWLSWQPPIEANGEIRQYKLIYNNDVHIVNCTARASICHNNTGEEINFQLSNLSSFTDYKVYVVAHTVKSSLPSNDVHFTTLVGIPSNPSHVEISGWDNKLMQWSKPSGRVDFYEVALTVWNMDKVERKRISIVYGATNCTVRIPPCKDSTYKHTLQVRAVNAVDRYSEFDPHISTSNAPEDVAALEEGNDDLKCVGKSGTTGKNDEERHYLNTNNYILYRSVWENGTDYACGSHGDKNGISVAELLSVALVIMGLFFSGYVVCSQCMKMARINCKLPEELTVLPAKNRNVDNIKDMDKDNGDSYQITANNIKDEVITNNESQFLLSYPYNNDSGYLCSGVDVPVSIGNSSGYATEGGGRQTPVKCATDDTYMAMESIKPTANPPQQAIANISNTISDTNGYVQPQSQLQSQTHPIKGEQPPPGALSIIPTVNRYVKINEMIGWQSTAAAGPGGNTAPSAHNGAVASCGYVAAEMLNKPAVPLFIGDGYTKPEALAKQSPGKNSLHSANTATETFGGGGGGGGGGISDDGGQLPAISGYVTQKELSALAHHRMS